MSGKGSRIENQFSIVLRRNGHFANAPGGLVPDVERGDEGQYACSVAHVWVLKMVELHCSSNLE